MRLRLLVAGAVISLAAVGMTWGALAASASPSVTPSPTATGSSQVGFTVDGTASPTPTSSASSPGSAGGSSGGGPRGSSGAGGAGGAGDQLPTEAVCLPTTDHSKLDPAPAPSPMPLKLSTAEAAQSSNLLVTAEGFSPGEKVVIALYGTPVKLGTSVVRSDGQVSASVTIPARTSLGMHTVQVLGYRDCRVAAAAVEIVSPSGSGASVFPWIVWLSAGGAVALALLGLLVAALLGWLPRGLALSVGTRAVS